MSSKFIDTIDSNEHKYALFTYVDRENIELEDFYKKIENDLTEDNKKLLSEIRNKDHIKGVAKIRGCFYTSKEANDKAEELIKLFPNDIILTCIIGRPFPLVNKGYSNETHRVDLNPKHKTEISDLLQYDNSKKNEEHERVMKEINERQENLIEDSKKDPNERTLDNHTTQRVKLANLIHSKNEMKDKIKLYSNRIKETKIWLSHKDNKEFENKYMEQYTFARKNSGISDEEMNKGFMKYIKVPLE